MIVAAACAAMAWAGCETERYVSAAQHPEVCITAAGGVTFRGRFVEPEDLPGLLRDASFRKTDTIGTSSSRTIPTSRRPFLPGMLLTKRSGW